MRCQVCHDQIRDEEGAHDAGLDGLVHPDCCPECNPCPIPGQIDLYDVLEDE